MNRILSALYRMDLDGMTAKKEPGQCRLMGIVNVTPDSFSDGGQFFDTKTAIEHGLSLVADGADILDIGGESTRPGAENVPIEQEINRVLPVVEGLVRQTDVAISIDTRKPVVAIAAINAGASIWNDVSALTWSPESVATAAELRCHVVLMHAQGDPKTMQDNPQYDDVVGDVLAFLAARRDACLKAGIEDTKIILDPGIGFGKTLQHNLDMIANLDRFGALGCPVLFGASRKRFIGALDRDGPADKRLGGSLAAAIAGYQRGASILRVHDVRETRQALNVLGGIENALVTP